MAIKADFKRGFVRNHWYATAWASEIGNRPIARRILDVPVVLFRMPDNSIGALEDQCPHRLAPLSLGECADGGLRCGYHGMVFGKDGKCLQIPAQDAIPSTAEARSFPVIERFGIVWLWTGDAPVDNALLPRIPAYGRDGWEVLENGYQKHLANYRIEIENLMDPAHTTYLHKETVGDSAARDVPVQVARSEHGLKAFRWIENIPPTSMDRAARDFGDRRVDRQIAFHFELPATSFVDVAVIPSGAERNEANLSAGLRTYSYKFLTPETHRSTHFFWLHIRNFRIGESEFNARLRANLEKTFLEDNAMASAIQLEQERTGLRQKTALAIDRAPIMALHMIDRMIEAESSGSA